MVWLSDEPMIGANTERATQLIEGLEWGTTVWPLVESSTMVGLLAELLSTRWVRDRHLDLWGIYLTHCAGDQARDYYIAGVLTSQLLKDLPAEKDKKKPWTHQGMLVETLDMVIREKYQRVLLPANINNNHWILFCIDFVKRSIIYGMTHQPTMYECVYSPRPWARRPNAHSGRGERHSPASRRAAAVAEIQIPGGVHRPWQKTYHRKASRFTLVRHLRHECNGFRDVQASTLHPCPAPRSTRTIFHRAYRIPNRYGRKALVQTPIGQSSLTLPG